MTNEQLVELIQAGTDVADNMLRLYQQTAGLIAKIAGDYRGQEDLEDLKQQGYLGLYPAVDGYRAETGVPFASYAAYWMREPGADPIRSPAPHAAVPAVLYLIPGRICRRSGGSGGCCRAGDLCGTPEAVKGRSVERWNSEP